MNTTLRTILTALTACALVLLQACGESDTPTPGNDPAPIEQPPAETNARYLLEIDRMSGTQPIAITQTLGGETVSLANIYGAAGVELCIVADQSDLPRTDTVRLADLHALMAASSNRPPEPGEGKVHVLVVTEDDERPDTLGIMFDFGANDSNDIPREAFAIFESAHQGLPGGVTPEVLLTTAHELAHAFNLHHTDWQGSSFRNDATIESYSLTDSVRWALSDASIAHLRSHPGRLVKPGANNLAFGLITQTHADGHQSVPLESYSIVADDLSTLRRGRLPDTAAAIKTQRATARFRTNEPLALAIAAPKTSFVIGEPVSLTVTLTNRDDQAHEVIPLLSPEYGFLTVLIKGPDDSDFRVFRPPVLRGARSAAVARSLAPDESLIDEAKVFFGSDGWNFERPGQYSVMALFPADADFSGAAVQSDIVTLTVREPDSEATTRARALLRAPASDRLGREQGLFLYMGGGTHLKYGAEKIRELVNEAPEAAQTDAARLALAKEAIEPTIDPERRVKPGARLDEAKQYLDAISKPENTSSVTMMQVQSELIEKLEQAGRGAEAEELRNKSFRELELRDDLRRLDRRILRERLE